MDHADHVRLLRNGVGVSNEVGVWADLGAGDGAFTLALAELMPSGSTLYAVDRDAGALAENERAYLRFGRDRDMPLLRLRVDDFTKGMDLEPLDGIVMANSLHFVKDKAPVLARIRGLLKPGAQLILVEYDTDDGNRWVPYPLSFETWRALAVSSGFTEPRLLASEPSHFLRQIYSASSATDRIASRRP